VTPRQPAPQGIQEPVGGAVQKQAELMAQKGNRLLPKAPWHRSCPLNIDR
jgi:hypothetical protein